MEQWLGANKYMYAAYLLSDNFAIRQKREGGRCSTKSAFWIIHEFLYFPHHHHNQDGVLLCKRERKLLTIIRTELSVFPPLIYLFCFPSHYFYVLRLFFCEWFFFFIKAIRFALGCSLQLYTFSHYEALNRKNIDVIPIQRCKAAKKDSTFNCNWQRIGKYYGILIRTENGFRAAAARKHRTIFLCVAKPKNFFILTVRWGEIKSIY